MSLLQSLRDEQRCKLRANANEAIMKRFFPTHVDLHNDMSYFDDVFGMVICKSDLEKAIEAIGCKYTVFTYTVPQTVDPYVASLSLTNVDQLSPKEDSCEFDIDSVTTLFSQVVDDIEPSRFDMLHITDIPNRIGREDSITVRVHVTRSPDDSRKHVDLRKLQHGYDMYIITGVMIRKSGVVFISNYNITNIVYTLNRYYRDVHGDMVFLCLVKHEDCVEYIRELSIVNPAYSVRLYDFIVNMVTASV